MFSKISQILERRVNTKSVLRMGNMSTGNSHFIVYKAIVVISISKTILFMLVFILLFSAWKHFNDYLNRNFMLVYRSRFYLLHVDLDSW